MLPELPDARMETRKPIGCSSLPPEIDAGLKPGATQSNFQNDGISIPARQHGKKD